jgi:hypothetical protein
MVLNFLLMMQYEAALAVDAVTLIARGLTRMIVTNKDVFKHTLRNGKLYNNGTDKEGIDCDAEPVVPWVHGYDIMNAMREVSVKFVALAYKRNFSPYTARCSEAWFHPVVAALYILY